ncbi:MAG: type I-E CRISPR-associated protein Cse1/CasA [Candidatus Methanomethylophilaceae archaeon]|nr:type I-E CRISPR-associated protein Cse1/CasA [Candidatus Methanomethylophilaceae archaeon]
MDYSFNLVKDAWIPCIKSNGDRQELGIRDALINAKDIAEIIHASPIISGSIHRLLISILQRAITLSDLSFLERMWDRGSWESNVIIDYLDEWQSRFDIFDEERPFFQAPGFQEGEPTTISKLGLELSAGNNTILFDHRFDDVVELMHPACVARLLVACQYYAVGGGRSSTTYTRSAPLVGKAQILLKGCNLFETLSLNLIPYDPNYPMRFTDSESDGSASIDLPSWERIQAETPGGIRYVNGYLDYLTWQSRAIRLLPETTDEGVRVSQMYFAQGVQMEDQLLFEPMSAYWKHEKHGLLPIKITIEREPWRSLSSFMHIGSEGNRPPKTVDVVTQLVNREVIDRAKRYEADVIGISNDKAKVLLWRHARMPFPAAYLQSPDLVRRIEESIHFAEEVHRSVLSKSVWQIATGVLSFNTDETPPKDAVKRLMASYDVERSYWSGMESEFYRLVDQMAASLVEDDHVKVDEAMMQWGGFVRRAAIRCFEKLITNVSIDVRGMRASVKSRINFYNNLNKEYGELEDKYENGKNV